MGLDMYLFRRNRLNEEQKVRAEELRNKVEKLNEEVESAINVIAEELNTRDKLDKLDMAGSAIDEYIKYRDLIYQEVMDEAESRKEYVENKQLLTKLETELSELYGNVEVGYWRKHADLHGHFESLYMERGGNEVFNCEELILDEDDLQDILEMAKEASATLEVVEKATGFFWGETIEEDWLRTIDILERVLKETDFEKHEIYYYAWW